MKTRVVRLEVVEIDDSIIENEQPLQTTIYKDEEEIDPSLYFDKDLADDMVSRAAVEINITSYWRA